MTDEGRPHLVRAVGASQFFTLGFGAIVGVGWIVVMGDLLNQAGPLGAILAFLAGAVIIVLAGFCYAELATMLPVSGGEPAYAYEAFGLGTAFAVGWGLVLFNIIVVSYLAISAAWILEYLFPWVGGRELYSFRESPVRVGALSIALIVTLVLTWINYRGVKATTRFQDYTTYGKIGIAVIFISAGIAGGEWTNLQPLFQRTASGAIFPGVIAVMAVTPWFYGGFNSIPQMMEEKAPGTSLEAAARTIVLSVVAGAAFYCLIILAVAMVRPWRELVAMDLPTATAFRVAFGSPLLSTLVLVAGLLGTVTVGNAMFLGGTRILFALSRGRLIHPFFATVHPRFGSPARSVLVVGAGAAAVTFLGREAIMLILNVGGSCLAFGYASTCLSMIRLRRSQAQRPRPCPVPGGIFTAVLASAGTLYMLGSSLYQPYATVAGGFPLEWRVLLAWSAVGWLLWKFAAGVRQDVGEGERQSMILGSAASP